MIPPWLQMALATGIWGCTWIVITTQLNPVPAAWSVAYRFIIAAAALFGWVLWKRLPLQAALRQHLMLALMGSLLFCLNYLFVYESEKLLPSGLVAVAFSLMVVAVPLLARGVLGQPITRALRLGALLAIPGVLLLYWPQVDSFTLSDSGLRGLLMVLAGVLCASAGNVLSATTSLKPLSVLSTNAWAMAYGGCCAALYAAVSAGPPTISTDPLYLAGLLYLAIPGSVIAFSLYVALIRHWGAGRAAYTNVLIPVIALGLSTAFEGYRLDVMALTGMAMVLAGTALAVRGKS